MDDLHRQREEIEVLVSIYGSDWKTESLEYKSYAITLTHPQCNDLNVTLCYNLPVDYPSKSPPVCEISAPNLKKSEKDTIYDALNEIYMENIGETILYQWTERVREILEALKVAEVDSKSVLSEIIEFDINLNPKFEIIHGDIIEDRKSTFQAHVAVIHHLNDVEDVIQQLKIDRKIADATHNIAAWRLNGSEDFDDDGEKGAGKRLLNLLELTNVKDVVVVVSRWYGGILLGKTRFRHINNAARQAMLLAGLIDH